MKKLLIVTLTIALIFALATCNDDKGDDTSPCTCLSTYGTTAHLGIDEDCTCGGEDCKCTEQTGNVGIIPVRKVKSVSVAEMNSAVSALSTSYTQAVTGMEGVGRLNEIVAIHLTYSGAMLSYGTDNILKLRLDCVAEAVESEVLYAIGSGAVEPGWTVD